MKKLHLVKKSKSHGGCESQASAPTLEDQHAVTPYTPQRHTHTHTELVHVRAHAHTHTHTHTRAHPGMYAGTHARPLARPPARPSTGTQVRMHLRTDTRAHARADARTHACRWARTQALRNTGMFVGMQAGTHACTQSSVVDQGRDRNACASGHATTLVDLLSLA